MCEQIPYGPERKPWIDTLSPWAKGLPGEPLLVSAPSQDPMPLYSFPETERDLTPSFYQVPSTGLTVAQQTEAQDQTREHCTVQTENFLGYQTTMRNDYDVVSAYLGTLANNIGDPYVPGSMTINTKWMERNVLDYYASLWNAKWPHDPKDKDSYWGYVLTMGSSEGNLYGTWNARDYLQGKFMMTDVRGVEQALAESAKGKIVTPPQGYMYVQAKPPKENKNAFTPIAFYSEDTHYSAVKAMTVLEIKTFFEVGNELYPNQCPLGGEWPREVPSVDGAPGPGHIDIDALCKLVNFFTKEGYPALIILNYGSTFKGAYDDVKTVGERLVPILHDNNMYRRWIKVEDPNTGQTVWRKRSGFWIHVDGALGASYAPFIHMAIRKDPTCVPSTPPPIFDFRLPFVSSICTSGHKWIGAPWPCCDNYHSGIH